MLVFCATDLHTIYLSYIAQGPLNVLVIPNFSYLFKICGMLNKVAFLDKLNLFQINNIVCNSWLRVFCLLFLGSNFLILIRSIFFIFLFKKDFYSVFNKLVQNKYTLKIFLNHPIF